MGEIYSWLTVFKCTPVDWISRKFQKIYQLNVKKLNLKYIYGKK